VRIPKAWVPASGEVVLRREGKRIIISEAAGDLRALARGFAEDGLIEFKRPAQPATPPTKSMS